MFGVVVNKRVGSHRMADPGLTYKEAVKFLDSCTNYEHTPKPQSMRRIKLYRMQRLCALLGDPQRSFRSVLVAGTNAKGSICAMLYALLQGTPMRIGLYTSPHLDNLRERIRVWPQPAQTEGASPFTDWISEEAFAKTATRVQEAAAVLRRGGPAKDAPTYFELLTAIAFVHFQQSGVDLAVLEVGLGGRLDATNVVDAGISVIGPLALDHTSVLGSDVLSIAKEKAGIIKPGQRVISAAQSDDADAVLKISSEAYGSPVFRYGRDFNADILSHTLEGLTLNVQGMRGTYRNLSLPLLGRHQAENAAVAIAALECLADAGTPHSLIEQGLSRVAWPGRIEVVSDSPLVLLDGAHNPQAAQALANTLRELLPARKIHVLIGMSSDKDSEAVAQILGPLATSVTCTSSRNPRALDAAVLANRFRPYASDIHVIADPADASTCVLNAMEPADVLLVTGSFFLVGAMRNSFTHARTRRQALAVS